MKRGQLCSQDLEMKRDTSWQPSGRDRGKKAEKTGLNFLLRVKKAARPGQKLESFLPSLGLHTELEQLHLLQYITMDHLGFSFLLVES